MLATILIPLGLPAVSAIGCSPGMGDFESEGPYPESLEGFVGVDEMILRNRFVEKVYVVEPGASVNMTFGYSLRWGGLEFKPRLSLSYPTGYLTYTYGSLPKWLSASYSPEKVVVQPKVKTNVTVTLNISKDAPRGEYMLVFGGIELANGEPVMEDCIWGAREFILRVGVEKPSHVFKLTYVSWRSTGNARVQPFSEGGQLQALFINLGRGSSVELNFTAASEYPKEVYPRARLASMPSKGENITIPDVSQTILIRGDIYLKGWEYWQRILYQHRNATVSLTLTSKDGIVNGAYPALFIISVQDIDYTADPKGRMYELEAVEVPIFITVGEGAKATDTIAKTFTYRSVSTITRTETATATIQSTTTETVTLTTPTTMTSTSILTSTATTTLTETTTETSVERVAEPSTYVWAVGATAIAIVLTAALVSRKGR